MEDDYSYIKECGQAKRRDNLEKSTAILEEKGVRFISKNNGVHLIVKDKFDYWPSTGLFCNKVTKKKGRGIFNLLKILDETD